MVDAWLMRGWCVVDAWLMRGGAWLMRGRRVVGYSTTHIPRISAENFSQPRIYHALYTKLIVLLGIMIVLDSLAAAKSRSTSMLMKGVGGNI